MHPCYLCYHTPLAGERPGQVPCPGPCVWAGRSPGPSQQSQGSSWQVQNHWGGICRCAVPCPSGLMLGVCLLCFLLSFFFFLSLLNLIALSGLLCVSSHTGAISRASQSDNLEAWRLFFTRYTHKDVIKWSRRCVLQLHWL